MALEHSGHRSPPLQTARASKQPSATRPPELRVVEASTDARFVGQPAYRVRYVHRPWQDAALTETVVTGTMTPRGWLVAKLVAPHHGKFAVALADYGAVIADLALEPKGQAAQPHLGRRRGEGC